MPTISPVTLSVTNLQLAGSITGATTGAFSGAVTAASLVLSGSITGATTGAFSGAVSMAGLTATTGAFSGDVTLSSDAAIGAGTNPVRIGRLSNSTTYGAISFGSSLDSTTAGFVGIFGRESDNYLGIKGLVEFQNAVTLSSTLAVANLVKSTSANGGFQVTRRDTNAVAWTLYSAAGGLSFYDEAAFADKIKVATGGAVTIVSLAGTGTRTVVVDANGVLSAP